MKRCNEPYPFHLSAKAEGYTLTAQTPGLKSKIYMYPVKCSEQLQTINIQLEPKIETSN
jgi:hypothetical protein